MTSHMFLEIYWQISVLMKMEENKLYLNKTLFKIFLIFYSMKTKIEDLDVLKH
jgi:hypothetical protein